MTLRVTVEGLRILWPHRRDPCSRCAGTGKPVTAQEKALGSCSRCAGSGNEHETILREMGQRPEAYVTMLLAEIDRLTNLSRVGE